MMELDALVIPTLQKTILVVEDSDAVRSVILSALEYEGYKTLEASNGVEALEVLKRQRPDLILSDINMPQMDGIQFYQAVRKIPSLTAIPFVFLTSHSDPADIQRGRELGVEDYLTKPIEPEALVKIINARLYRAAAIEAAQVNQAYLDTVNVLANAIEGRDRYTRGHVERVTTYSLWLARSLGWSERHLRVLEFGARLHDIGKIIIPDDVLNKPGKLTEEEWRLMRSHTIEGARMLRKIHHLRETLPYILFHHERWDGKGYPKGLSGKNIPIQARVLALADVYDALATTRSYRKSMPHEQVIEIIRQESGKHFDPHLVPRFIEIMNRMRDRIPRTRPLR
ncbi:MAG: response regulator [Anaerolineae bacterium]|nr:MAG: response regulator [Anaerolineae bacterium]